MLATLSAIGIPLQHTPKEIFIEKVQKWCVLSFQNAIKVVTKLIILTILKKIRVKSRLLIKFKTSKIKNYVKYQVLTFKMPIGLAMSFKG